MHPIHHPRSHTAIRPYGARNEGQAEARTCLSRAACCCICAAVASGSSAGIADSSACFWATICNCAVDRSVARPWLHASDGIHIRYLQAAHARHVRQRPPNQVNVNAATCAAQDAT